MLTPTKLRGCRACTLPQPRGAASGLSSWPLGVLAALGFSPLRRGGLLLFVGSLGSGVGAVLGYFGAYSLVQNHVAVERFLKEEFGFEIFASDIYVIDGIPVHWDPAMAVKLTLAAFLTGVLFTLGPAIRAASLSPVEALRYE